MEVICPAVQHPAVQHPEVQHTAVQCPSVHCHPIVVDVMAIRDPDSWVAPVQQKSRPELRLAEAKFPLDVGWRHGWVETAHIDSQ